MPVIVGGSGSGTLVHLHHSSKIKVIKKSQNSRIRGFSCYFCYMMEVSGAGAVLLSNGYGSERPKNLRRILTDPDRQHCFIERSYVHGLFVVFGSALPPSPSQQASTVLWTVEFEILFLYCTIYLRKEISIWLLFPATFMKFCSCCNSQLLETELVAFIINLCLCIQ
jgi:hypothetical protein